AELDLPALWHRSDIAGRRERAALAGHDAAGALCLSIHLDNIHAVHVPERHGLARQRRAPADDELERIEAKLVEDRPEHGGVEGAVKRLLHGCRVISPAAARVRARVAHGELVA